MRCFVQIGLIAVALGAFMVTFPLASHADEFFPGGKFCEAQCININIG